MTAPLTVSAYHSASHLAVRLQAHEAPPINPAIHLGILLDTSGSMEGDRLDAVKRTLNAARDLFRPEDRVTLVTFDDHGRAVTRCAPADAAFYAAVESIHTNGCTDLSAGVEVLLTARSAEMPYTAIVVLTDGMINRGITSAAGLRSMFAGLGDVAITALGYGADHNRTLLRDLSIASRGSYTYVNSDEVLPVVMGDLLEGLRSEVLRGVQVSVTGQGGWACAEVANSEGRVGTMIPGRDYWIVFHRLAVLLGGPEHPTIRIVAAGMPVLEVEAAAPDDAATMDEQVARCDVANALAQVAAALESGRGRNALLDCTLNTLKARLAAMDSPLVLRLRAQVEEALAALAEPPVHTLGLGGGGGATPDALARLSSGAAYLTTQRGVGLAMSPDPADAQIFSSPAQRQVSAHCHTSYMTPHDPTSPE